MHDKIDKKYIYERDNHKCYFCKKELKLGNISIDHYYPRSHGGTYDVFNLVVSCKKCNIMKKSRIPEDAEIVAINLFKRAVLDRRIHSTIACLMQDDLIEIVSEISELRRIDEITVFKSLNNEVYVKHNKVFKIIGLIY